MRIVDLTLPIQSDSPLLPAKIYQSNPVKLVALAVVDNSQRRKLLSEGYDLDSKLDAEYGVMVSRLSTPTHGGTNIDAPRHFVPSGIGIDQVPLSTLVGTCVVLDVPAAARSMVEIDDVTKYEAKIKAGDTVLIRTGWTEKHYGKPDYISEMPGVTEEVARWLVSKGVKAVAHDCFPDIPSFRVKTAARYPNHRIYLSKGVIIIENLTNTSQLCKERFLILALPLKLVNSDGSPARVIGIEDIGWPL